MNLPRYRRQHLRRCSRDDPAPPGLKRFERRPVESEIMDIGRGNCTGDRETFSIDQSTQFISFYLLIAIIAGRSPFLASISFVSVAQCERSIFRISYPNRSNSRKIAWYTPFSHNLIDSAPEYLKMSFVESDRITLSNTPRSYQKLTLQGFFYYQLFLGAPEGKPSK
jgi:hypothetical protein